MDKQKEKNLIQKLAEYSHNQWCERSNFLLNKLDVEERVVDYDGTTKKKYILPNGVVEMWKKLSSTNYRDLCNADKEVNITKAKKILEIVQQEAAQEEEVEYTTVDLDLYPDCCITCKFFISDNGEGFSICDLNNCSNSNEPIRVDFEDKCTKFQRKNTVKEEQRKELRDKIKRHYWCCSTCAKEAGGKLCNASGVTMTQGKCEVCKADNVTLIPWVDFNWKQATDNSDAVAKLARD